MNKLFYSFLILFLLFASIGIFTYFTADTELEIKKRTIKEVTNNYPFQVSNLQLLKKNPIKDSFHHYYFPKHDDNLLVYSESYRTKEENELFTLQVTITSNKAEVKILDNKIKFQGQPAYYSYLSYLDKQNEAYVIEQLSYVRDNMLYEFFSLKKSNAPMKQSQKKLLQFLDENLIALGK